MNKKEITLGFSPCPNDCFIFDGLVNNKIDTRSYKFKVILEDVQTLNEWALKSKLDISKISYSLLPSILDQYNLLDSGSALGKGVGPLLIARSLIPDLNTAIESLTIALPGKLTTANLLFSMAFPGASQKKYLVFSEIENAVLSGEVDCGVIIHESRFTYQQKGLVKLMDLGDFWEKETGLPIPLGGIVMKKEFDLSIQKEIELLIRESLQLAFANYPELPEYVKANSQEMDESVMRKHIELYVNRFSLELGDEGRLAIKKLMSI